MDLTGGYKTMSAAAAAIGFQLPGARVVYVETRQRRIAGRPFWFDTRVEEVADPALMFGDREREAGARALAAGDYPTARALYAPIADRLRDPRDRWRADLAELLDHADRLALVGLPERFDELARQIEVDAKRERGLRSDPLVAAVPALRRRATALRGLVEVLEASGAKADPARTTAALKVDGCLQLAGWLMAQARRRLDRDAPELAALYAYRAMELVPARRLATLGVEVEAVDWAALAQASPAGVARFEARRKARPDKLARADALLALWLVFRDALVPPAEVDKLLGLGESRNRSVLAHGLASVDAGTARTLIDASTTLLGRLLALEGRDPATLEALLADHGPLPG